MQFSDKRALSLALADVIHAARINGMLNDAEVMISGLRALQRDDPELQHRLDMSEADLLARRGNYVEAICHLKSLNSSDAYPMLIGFLMQLGDENWVWYARQVLEHNDDPAAFTIVSDWLDWWRRWGKTPELTLVVTQGSTSLKATASALPDVQKAFERQWVRV